MSGLEGIIHGLLGVFKSRNFTGEVIRIQCIYVREDISDDISDNVYDIQVENDEGIVKRFQFIGREFKDGKLPRVGDTVNYPPSWGYHLSQDYD